MISRKKILFLILIVIVGFVAFKIIAKVSSRSEVQQTTSVSKIPVQVTQIKSKRIEQTLILTGDVRGLNEARVYPKVPGRLMKKIKDVGDFVSKGEVIALVDRDEPALQFAPAEVTSPLDGILTQYWIDLGEAITPSVAICEVADISQAKIVVSVPERDLPKIKLSQTARFSTDAYPDEIFWGRIARISQALSVGSRAAEVEIYADNPGKKLKPGMFTTVEIILAVHDQALVVPREAVSEVGGTYYAFVVKNEQAQRRFLTIGIVKPQELEILNGLAKGETLVTVGWHNLTEGTKVEIVEWK